MFRALGLINKNAMEVQTGNINMRVESQIYTLQHIEGYLFCWYRFLYTLAQIIAAPQIIYGGISWVQMFNHQPSTLDVEDEQAHSCQNGHSKHAF